MELTTFIQNFANLFDDIDVSEISADTKFKELEEWGSLTGMGLIALARTKYNKSITGLDIRNCSTIEDLYNLISSK